MQRHVPGNQPRSPGAAAVTINCLLGCCAQRRMVGEAEIIVGREIDDFPVFDQQRRTLVAFDAAQRPIEPFVPQVFKLGLKKTRIHERIIMYPFMGNLSKGLQLAISQNWFPAGVRYELLEPDITATWDGYHASNCAVCD